jgi:flagellar biosynthetic protein FliR
MTLEIQTVGTFLVFCRVGACLMVMPGLSTARVPARIRLYLAVVVSLMIAPVVEIDPNRLVNGATLLPAIAAECLTGVVIGLIARLLVEAVSFAASAISSYVGLTGLLPEPESGEQSAVLSGLLTITATMLLLNLGLAQQLLITVVDSYTVVPAGVFPQTAVLSRQLVDVLSATFLMALRLTAPFIAFGLIVNAAFGIAGKLVPQVQSYFLSTPFLLLGGLALLYLVFPELMRVFTDVALIEVLKL